MRLPSALVVFTVAALATGCSIPVAPSPRPDPAVASLKDLGVEGRTYVSDLGADRSFRLNRMFPVGDDVLLEDINGHLVYLDGATLNVRWVYYGLPRPFDEAPDSTETSIVGVSKEKVYVLSRKNGLEEIPPAAVGVIPSAAPVANDSTLYIPTYRTPGGNKTVVAVNLANGYRGWGFRTEQDVEVDLAKAGQNGGDMIYFAASGGMVYGFPAFHATERSPEPAWMVDLLSGVHRNLSVFDGDPKDPAAHVIGVVTDDHRLIVLDRITGGVRWEAYPNQGDRAGSGAQFSSKFAFYECGGELRAFDLAGGSRAWSVKGATTFVAERGDRTILSDGNGTLYAVATKTGKVLGKHSMPGWRFPTRTKPDATLIAISNAGMVVAVETGW